METSNIIANNNNSHNASSTVTHNSHDCFLDLARSSALVMKSLSHETRFHIMLLLDEDEVDVSTLENQLNLPQAVVSQQLARLRKDGLVKSRRDGRSIYYSNSSPIATKLLHFIKQNHEN